ncbi:MAG: hypothetical protein A2991_00205 [Candidatus Terrybacteria bacterium RIFCSPLOWO2_01_FULL_58_14]|uniref:Uncharacterized protein n=1 Tax=Candidatus Terrybacteria bacterium RIFCSPLOWO2_01_FULL_58_14 TaxID=1802369 RepID=A0A1G2PWW2_9BACT|nr:MAG: hypothetical protein A2991_00205 [Candidatus Terrybacteria bacterium RIFCSPLOWO2_01_FULL_58_14]
MTFTAPEGTAIYTVRALPAEEPISLDALDQRFSREFSSRALADSLLSSRFGLPGVGVGISYEARVPKGDRADPLLVAETTNLSYLTLMVASGADASGASEEENPEGRGYVIEALFTGGAQQERIDSAHARRMTRTLRLVDAETLNSKP